MRTSLLLASLTLAAVAAFSGASQSQAGLPTPPAPPGLPGLPVPPVPPLPGVNVRIEGYLPAPPGVHIYYSNQRPYYIKGGRRVYLARDPHYRGRGLKKGHRKHGR